MTMPDRPRPWWFWPLVGGGTFSVVSLLAVAILLRVPALPNCPSIFWPLASASMRLYCAEVAANKRTVRDLLEAIALVSELPVDHELRPQVNRYLDRWVDEILRLADGAVEAGNLEEGLKMARKIPETVPNHDRVVQRMVGWQRDWQEAERVYGLVLRAINDRRWDLAVGNSNRLLRGPLRYWATVKHNELKTLIAETRQDDGRIRRAEALADRGGVENFRQALELLQVIEPRRRLYALAQQTVAEITERAVGLAQRELDRGNGAAALAWVELLPDRDALKAQAEDLQQLAEAETLVKGGTAGDLEAAIAAAGKIATGRPLYDRAQFKIAQWQRDLGDAATLDRARALAQAGSAEDLSNAIAAAQDIPETSSLATLARKEIAAWSRQIQVLRDRPLLDQAEALAEQGRFGEAIAEAQKIEPESPLAANARSQMAAWRSQLEQARDEPILQQAEQLAAAGDLTAAIQQAQRASQASASRVQRLVSRWQGQLQDQNRWAEAQQLAASNQPDGLIGAIATASRISRNSTWRGQADSAIANWSQQLLVLAQQQAASGDLPGAIALARRIPRAATTYDAAQTQIATWQRWLPPAATPGT
ncbi:MAG: chromosome segregation ATPase [Oscillatoriales cyanobacterium]|nr:MAG: chromosome segregation ATPase [Oscillatoriales cyanobacterium]